LCCIDEIIELTGKVWKVVEFSRLTFAVPVWLFLHCRLFVAGGGDFNAFFCVLLTSLCLGKYVGFFMGVTMLEKRRLLSGQLHVSKRSQPGGWALLQCAAFV